MRLPIAYALAWPERARTPFGRIDWAEVGRLDFEAPDLEAFPCLALAFAAGRAGGSAPAWLNAANEVAVAAFLEGRIRFDHIHSVNLATLAAFAPSKPGSLGDLLELDARSRAAAHQAIARLAS
jgi:1-deoxy-D-xylulose-5-phosphate reductoisomerase